MRGQWALVSQTALKVSAERALDRARVQRARGAGSTSAEMERLGVLQAELEGLSADGSH